MFCFEILRIFGEKLQNSKAGNLGISGYPHCSIDLRCCVGCLASTRPRGQNGIPQVRHGVEKLRRNEVLRCNVAIVHNEQILDFCF